MGSDWHEITDSVSVYRTALSAASASFLTKTILYPMDTIKCRMQSFVGTGKPVWRMHGILNGLIPKVLLYVPYQSVYMSTYTYTRNGLHGNTPGDPGMHVFVGAAVCAELAGSIIRVPMEAMKQRMQTGLISNNSDLVKSIIANPFSFFRIRNFVAQTLVHDLPVGAVHWVVYEKFKRAFSGEGGVGSATAGAVAGTITATLTNPLDVVKTRMITRPREILHETVKSTVSAVFRESGLVGFYRGVGMRILHIAPNSALYMFLFDHIYSNISTTGEFIT